MLGGGSDLEKQTPNGLILWGRSSVDPADAIWVPITIGVFAR